MSTKQNITRLLAAALLAFGAEAASAAVNIDPIPAAKANPEANAWEGLASRPALAEALSRTPGSGRNAGAFPSMPIEGEVRLVPQALPAFKAMDKVPACAGATTTNIVGYLGYSTLGLESGYYTIPLSNSTAFGELSLLPTLTLTDMHGGTVTPHYAVFTYADNLYVNGQRAGYTAIVDRSTWTVLGQAGDYGDYGRWASDMTYDPTTNRVYGCFLNDEGSAWELGFMQIDDNVPANTVSNVRKVATLETSLNGIACDENGTLWGIRNDNGALVTINRKSAEMTTVVATQYVPQYNGSLAWDDAQHLLYWAICYGPEDNVQSALCTVDVATGALASVNNFEGNGAQFCSLGVDFAAVDFAPAPPANMAVNFSGYEYSGSVSFDVPSTLENGQAASGEVIASLTVSRVDNHAQVLSANVPTTYGAKGVTIPVELQEAGYYAFDVKLISPDGESYPNTVNRYVGIDLPAPISGIDINADLDLGRLTVAWSKVSTPLNGGYFNPDNVIYNVVIKKMDAANAQTELYNAAITDTCVVLDIPVTTALQAYSATVTAVSDGVTGQMCRTAWQWFGYYLAPFADTMKQAGAWTTQTFSANGWSSSSSGWYIPYVWGQYNNAWLFSPAVMLTEGEVYNISVNAQTSVVNHTGKICIGTAPESGAMTRELCSYSVEDRDVLNTFTAIYVCPKTGIYHFGILNDTRSDTWTNVPNVYFTNFTVTSVDHGAPAAPQMQCNRSTDGDLALPVKVTMPTLTHGGAPLSGTLSLTVKRGTDVVYTKEGVAPGEVCEFTDTPARSGLYSYTAYATNDVADGVPVQVDTYVGIGVPLDPAWVKAAEDTDSVGKVNVSWAPVTLNTQGLEMTADSVKYNVINILSNSYVQQGVSGSSFSFKGCGDGEQEAYYISVNAMTADGSSSTYGTYSGGLMFVGTPAELPVRETFAPGLPLCLPWITVNQSSGYDGFNVVNMMEQEGIADANGDGQALMGFCPYSNGSVCLYSGTINVPSTVNAPAFSYAVLNTNFGSDGNNNLNEVTIYLMEEAGGAIIDQYAINSMPLGWNYRYIDLSGLKGKKVHIMIQIHTLAYTTYYFDDLRLFDRPDYDIALTSVSVAEQVQPGAPFDINVALANNGAKTLALNATAKIELVRDGKVANSIKVPPMRTLATSTVKFTDRINIAEAPGADYTLRLVYDNDTNPDNDALSASVKLILPDIPAPTALVGDRGDDGYPVLEWQAPDLTPVYESTTAYFEGFQGYSLIHLDGFSTFELTGNAKDVSNFTTAHGFELMYQPNLSHSGNCFLMSAACLGGAAKEDWLVSPKLSGRAQTVTFYVRTINSAHESFSVYASATGDARADFAGEPLYAGRTLSDNWEQVAVDLPEGTLYFAIACKADDTSDLLVFMVDDVVYEAVPANSMLSLQGYRVYRNREEQPLAEVAATAYNDSAAEIGTHSYRVTAVYDGLESAPTSEVSVFSRGGAPVSGIQALEQSGVKVSTQAGLVKVELDGTAAVGLYDYAGICIYAAHTGSVDIPATSGIYIVVVDGIPARVIVP